MTNHWAINVFGIKKMYVLDTFREQRVHKKITYKLNGQDFGTKVAKCEPFAHKGIGQGPEIRTLCSRSQNELKMNSKGSHFEVSCDARVRSLGRKKAKKTKMNSKGSCFKDSGDDRVRNLGKVITKFIGMVRALSLQAARHLQYRRQGSYFRSLSRNIRLKIRTLS